MRKACAFIFALGAIFGCLAASVPAYYAGRSSAFADLREDLRGQMAISVGDLILVPVRNSIAEIPAENLCSFCHREGEQ